MSKPVFVIPTAIPFESLRSRELEECVYWLLDAMGAKELEWRLGNEGVPTADQGRDIEAHFSMSTPDADVVRQKWWIECKGRNRTVEPDAVKNSVINVTATPDIDVLVIVTNTTFSNPTRNWVKEWQKSHRRPTIKLWDKTDLERFLCRHPAAVLRVFSKALTPQGRLVVLRERFWQHSTYATEENLRELWEKKGELEWEGISILLAVVSEFANGSINRHPWLVEMECESFLKLLRIGLANALSFCVRAQEAGVDEGPYLDAMGYLLLRVLPRSSKNEIFSVLSDFMDVPTQDKQRVQAALLNPILSRLMMGVTDACTRDCVRLSSDLRILTEEVAEHYWDRLRVPAKEAPEQKSKAFLFIEKHDEPCKVGFKVDKNRHCPLLNLDEFESKKVPDLKVHIDVLTRVLRERIGQNDEPS